MLHFSVSESRGSAASPGKGSRIATGQSQKSLQGWAARTLRPPSQGRTPAPQGCQWEGGRERETLKAWSCPERKSPEFRGAVSQGALRSCGGQCYSPLKPKGTGRRRQTGNHADWTGLLDCKPGPWPQCPARPGALESFLPPSRWASK